MGSRRIYNLSSVGKSVRFPEHFSELCLRCFGDERPLVDLHKPEVIAPYRFDEFIDIFDARD